MIYLALLLDVEHHEQVGLVNALSLLFSEVVVVQKVQLATLHPHLAQVESVEVVPFLLLSFFGLRVQQVVRHFRPGASAGVPLNHCQ